MGGPGWGCDGTVRGFIGEFPSGTVRSSGKVTYKGQPVSNGTVMFMPDESKGTVGPPAMGIITRDGSYVLSTETSGDGVIIGSHKVGITGLEVSPITGEEAAPDPESDPEGFLKSKAKTAAIARGEGRRGATKQDADIFTDRGGRKFRFAVPRKFSHPEESGIIVKVDGAMTANFEIDESGQVRITP